MTEPLCIRAYGPDDRQRLLAIWHAASLKGHPFFTADQLREQAKLVGEAYLPKAENWVATLADEPIGFIGLLDTFIGGLFVDPARHGTGAGRHLVEYALSLKGELSLEVFALNTSAIGFYRHIGFVETGRRISNEHGMPLELVAMRSS
ncbi:GNAT family N-acetyltransferase [Neoaquamicrobium sediminum]|uniref:GNAT family N-acetyltransferase n=1 Tax=Neoaquamicrobium sediminum TaxID=1849104 RepID=UPI003BAB4533